MAADSTVTDEQKASGSTSEFIKQGWEFKTNGKFDDAEASFRKAISADPSSVEAYYGLSLTLKSQDRRQDSIAGFEKVLELIDLGSEDRVRGEMLRRLALAHINQLRSGDWNLEKEIWKRK
jgi:tetratricopeptide (TPR) repeat protein